MSEPCAFCKSRRTTVTDNRIEVIAEEVETVHCDDCGREFEVSRGADLLSADDSARVREAEGRIKAMRRAVARCKEVLSQPGATAYSSLAMVGTEASIGRLLADDAEALLGIIARLTASEGTDEGE